MEYRTLGKTGLKISRMGFGGIPIQKIDEEGTKKLLHAMAEKGINYIDSARGYTVSEQYIGYGLEGIRDNRLRMTCIVTIDMFNCFLQITNYTYRQNKVSILR